ncbi:FliH/SctL family protein [Modestobacter sp. VKM Ac-2977]|uniref:FliH/SctL family protein n=1 Tax=Modestobacter sp. VKM Ac-2977 TaxID=3004131 RepID=UPI0022AB1348|nr:FliH/SctL family protein [Modestobacter sp. VKM Ac-2977]MCZ2819172.1 FliH/SctL family protein [Modestobacter sp. VKM Ac-2977]
MTSSPDGSGRETLLLRGAPAAGAVPYQRVPQRAPVWGRPSAVRPAAQDAVAPAPAAPVPPPRAPRAPSVVPPAAPVDPTAAHPNAAHPNAAHPNAAHRTAAHSDQAATARVGLRLGEVYAEQLARLRAEARREGWAAGHAEGLVAAEQVVRAAEQAAEERLAEVQARWERRLASATAAMGAAVERLDGTAAPVVDELRDSILDAVVILVGDLFGRELAVAAEPGLDALRRAMTLCPDDVPVVVRLHPDDLAEVPAEALAQLPASVTVRGDDSVERAGAVAEAGTQRVDAQLSAALDRVREVLRS